MFLLTNSIFANVRTYDMIKMSGKPEVLQTNADFLRKSVILLQLMPEKAIWLNEAQRIMLCTMQIL